MRRWVPKIDSSTLSDGIPKAHKKLLNDLEQYVDELSDDNWKKLLSIVKAEKIKRDEAKKQNE